MDHDAWNGKVSDGQAEQGVQAENDLQAERELPNGESPPTCVLLVEDEFLIAEIIGEALEEHGFCVLFASNATEAMEHLSTGSRVDILFTDINLPGELDGVGLAEQVRGQLPDLPVIYASGRWGRLDELRSRPLSMILQKPYSPARACAAIELLMSRHSAALQAKQQKALAS